MLDLEPIKKRLAAATPGPWAWREDMFRPKYMKQMKNGNWRGKSGKSAKRSWVMLLTGPLHEPKFDFDEGNILQGYPDEWDFPHIIAIRWDDIKGTSLLNATPLPEDAALIENAPIDIAMLLEEVERLRQRVCELGSTID